MRWFEAAELGSVDREGGFRCICARTLDYDKSMGLDESLYQFRDINKNEQIDRVSLGAWETAWQNVEKHNGCGRKDIVIGGGYIFTQKKILAMKPFFRFDGTDLQFFEYLGSGVASCQVAAEMPLYGRAIYNRSLGELPGLSAAGLSETAWGPVLCSRPGRGCPK